MPKKTFENLPADKKEKITLAVKREFLSHKYSEISINRIIKEADIPRGSIYQYFDGKEDMLFLVVGEYCSYIIEMIKDALQANHGDIFAMTEIVLKKIFDIDNEWMERKGYRLLFSDSRVAGLLTDVTGQLNKSHPGEMTVIEAVRPYLDFSALDLKSPQEEETFLEILVDSLCKPIVYFLNDGVNRYEECMLRVNLLKKHFLKE